jgi:uncharacterized peroxidase-related enzyme
MNKINVPTKEQVSEENQVIFEQLENKVGFVPNIYATYALSDYALSKYLAFSNGKTSLTGRQKEAVYLVTSQVNGCTYCQAAHTASGKQHGFSDDQILEIRGGSASFDPKLDAIVKLAKGIAEKRGQVDDQLVDEYFALGFDEGNLVDVIVAVGEKTITNMVHNVTHIPIDFPKAPVLHETTHA